MEDEKLLITQLNAGNERAFETIYNNYYRSLVVYAFNLSKRQDIAEDIVQNVLSKIWVKRKELSIGTSLKSYLYRAVYNGFVSEYQKQSKENQLHSELKSNYLDEIFAQNEDVQEERMKLLKEALDQLPKKCKQVFLMSKIQGYKYREIAELLDISEKTVEKHISNGYATIKKILYNSTYLIKFLSFYKNNPKA